MNSKIKIKLSISPCPNDTYIFAALVQNLFENCEFEFETTFADVQTLNEMVVQKNPGLTKISFGVWPLIQSKNCLLNCGGAMGYGCGPLLLSTQEKLSPTSPLYLPGKYTTAKVLFDFWAHSQHSPFQIEYALFDEIYAHLKSRKISQAVAIHEGRFTFAQDNLFCIQDLGAFWEEHTQSPIPLGGIVLTKELAPYQSRLEHWIRESILYSKSNFETLFPWIQSMAQIEERSVIESHIQMFVNDFSFDMGTLGKKAIQVLQENQEKLQ